MLDDAEILRIVLGGAGGVDQTDELIQAANESGGEDNTTAILLKVE
jgi:serine/threonine protein phosphatase PrpC